VNTDKPIDEQASAARLTLFMLHAWASRYEDASEVVFRHQDESSTFTFDEMADLLARVPKPTWIHAKRTGAEIRVYANSQSQSPLADASDRSVHQAAAASPSFLDAASDDAVILFWGAGRTFRATLQDLRCWSRWYIMDMSWGFGADSASEAAGKWGDKIPAVEFEDVVAFFNLGGRERDIRIDYGNGRVFDFGSS